MCILNSSLIYHFVSWSYNTYTATDLKNFISVFSVILSRCFSKVHFSHSFMSVGTANTYSISTMFPSCCKLYRLVPVFISVSLKRGILVRLMFTKSDNRSSPIRFKFKGLNYTCVCFVVKCSHSPMGLQNVRVHIRQACLNTLRRTKISLIVISVLLRC